MAWASQDVTDLLSRLRLAEAFFEEMVDLPGFEPRPDVKDVRVTGYNPKLSCPLAESGKDFRARLEGVFARDFERNNEDGAADGKTLVVKKILYRGAELSDKKSLEDQGVSPSNVMHVVVALKKKKFFFF